MSEKNKPGNKGEDNEAKIQQHKKSKNASSSKINTSHSNDKNVQKTGTKEDDWNDPTGNSHLGKQS